MKIGARRLRGQSLVEFALVLPILLMIILGIIEAALVIQGHLAVQHVARETARFASTYQPAQGECVDLDEDGIIEDGYATHDTEDQAPWPNCPLNASPWAGPTSEDLAQYNERRLELIRRRARNTARGLRISRDAVAQDEDSFRDLMGEPGFFGVRVWGYPAFNVDCNNGVDAAGDALWEKQWSPGQGDQAGCLEYHGIPGAPMMVNVRHNVEILDPFYRAIVPHVPVEANAQMINEGVTVSLGGEPLPGFTNYGGTREGEEGELPSGPPVVVCGDGVRDDPEECDYGGDDAACPGLCQPDCTCLPVVNYEITLEASPERGGTVVVTNVLPIDYYHDFVATVTDEVTGEPAAAWVSFKTDAGSFDESTVGPTYVEARTASNGEATVRLWGNKPMTATIQAWIDEGYDDTLTTEEYAQATKIWEVPPGIPYIIVKSHDVFALHENEASAMVHSSNTTYELHWCVITGTVPGTTLLQVNSVPTFTTDVFGKATGLRFIVPEGSEGWYRLETHLPGNGCGDTDVWNPPVYSAPIRVRLALPDLVPVSLSEPITICPETVFTMSAVISNATPGSASETFDVDFYVDPVGGSPGPTGLVKQWVSGIDRGGTPGGVVTLNTTMWLDSPGEHTIWVRADTSDYVEEDNESNNVFSKIVTVEGVCFEDTFDRADSSTVGNGWVEVEAWGATVRVHSNQLEFDDTSDVTNRPMVRHAFDEVSSGELTWEFDFNWVRSGSEGAYRVFMQLGDGGSMSNFSWDQGVGVNLIWTQLGTHEMLGYRRDGSNTGLATVSGLTRIMVAADLDSGTYDVAVGGSTVGTDIPFDEAVDLNTVRFFTDAVSDDNITGHSFDNVSVRMNPCGPGSDPSPWPEVKPPGLVECEQVLEVGGFEGNIARVNAAWTMLGSASREVEHWYSGDPWSSMRVDAAVDDYGVQRLNGIFYQEVSMPGEVYSMTTVHVRGYSLAAPPPEGSLLWCENTSTDPGDALYLMMRDSGGVPLVGGNGVTITTGADASAEFLSLGDIDVTQMLSPVVSYAGQEVQVYFHGVNDPDEDLDGDGKVDCTFLYVDALECEVCTEWPPPDYITGTGSIEGWVQVVLHMYPQKRQGVDVWAYSADAGAYYHTQTIQNGVYHFYNIPPGTYTVYAEYWEDTKLHWSSETVPVHESTTGTHDPVTVNLFLP